MTDETREQPALDGPPEKDTGTESLEEEDRAPDAAPTEDAGAPDSPTPPEDAADEELEKRMAEPLLKGFKGIDVAQIVVSAFLIAILGVIAYSNSFGMPFHAEDQRLIRDNTALHSPATFGDALDPRMPRPFTMLTFALNWWITPGRAGSFHVINLGLHLGNGILVYLLCRRLFGKPIREPLAMVAGMLFVLHPLNTECVNYIVCRSGLLATGFTLLNQFQLV